LQTENKDDHFTELKKVNNNVKKKKSSQKTSHY
jgi:hypothetical protein